MKEILPIAFIVLSGLALCAVLYGLWQSLRQLLSARAVDAVLPQRADGQRQALLAEKQELLQAIRDVQFERDLGKISDRDFERLDRRYRTRAREVLRMLDEQLGPYRKDAEAMLQRVASGAKPSEPRPEPEPKPEPATTARACPACGQSNDADAVFCKKCAHRLTEGQAEAGPGEDAGQRAEAES